MAAFFKLFPSVLTIICVLIISENSAHAYLDPGSGSFIFQIVIAGLLGALVAVKRFWINIKTFFKNMFSRGEVQEPHKD